MHDLNQAFNQVILHVILYHQQNHEVLTELQQPVSKLELASHLQTQKAHNQIKTKESLRRFELLPERCGVWIHENDPWLLKEVLRHAAEQRMQNKMHQVLQYWQEHDPEELLFLLIFKSLGYSQSGKHGL